MLSLMVSSIGFATIGCECTGNQGEWRLAPTLRASGLRSLKQPPQLA